MHEGVNTYMYISMHVCTCVCMTAGMFTCIYVCTHVYMCISVHGNEFADVHV